MEKGAQLANAYHANMMTQFQSPAPTVKIQYGMHMPEIPVLGKQRQNSRGFTSQTI